MKKKLFLIPLIILLILSVGLLYRFTYAYFSPVTDDVKSEVSVNAKKLAIEHTGCHDLILEDAVPGAVITCDFSVTNNSNSMIIYDYELIDVYNDFSIREDLKYSISKNGVAVGVNYFPTDTTMLSADNCLDINATDLYTLRIEYLNQEYDQSIDMNKRASGKVNVTNVEDTNECYSRTYNVTVDPNGGEWNNLKAASVYPMTSGSEFDLTTLPFNEGYIFKGWSFTKDTKVKDNKIYVNKDVTATAIWDISEDCVARIDSKYYLTLEKAHTAAVAGDTITMIKNTKETVTMTKDVTLDLNGYTVDGLNDTTITNTGDLTIIGNGYINNDTGKGIVNNGELTLGENDGLVSIEYPHIYGKNIGIEQNNLFNFYDGIIIGITGCIGTYDQIPENYYVFVYHNDATGNQEVYLVNSFTTRAIARIDKVLYMNLQDAIDLNTEAETIYFIRNCELAYPVTNRSDDTTVIDMAGYTINSGYVITNNGDLTITDTGAEKGIWNSSMPINNFKTLTLKDMKMNSTTTYVTVDNKRDLTMINSQLIANDASVINTYHINMDQASVINSRNIFGLYNYDYGLLEGTGTIYGIYEATSNTGLTNKLDHAVIVNGPTIINKVGANGIFVAKNAELLFKSGTMKLPYDRTSGIYSEGSNTIRVENGTFEITSNTFALNVENNWSNVFVANATVNASSGCFIHTKNNEITVSGGTYNMSGRFATLDGSYTSRVFVHGGNYTCGGECFYMTDGFIGLYNGTLNSTGMIVNVKNGDVEVNEGASLTSNGITINKTGANNVNINGGTITSTNSNAINLTGSSWANIKGGTITADLGYGVFFNTTGGVNIGVNDGNISTTIPKIQGNTYAVYKEYGTFNYYDGVIIGKTYGNYGIINNLPTNCALKNTPTTVDGVDYLYGTIINRSPYLQVDDTTFNSVDAAVAAAIASESKTIKAISNVDYTDPLDVPAGKGITFDLAGHSINILTPIMVNGVLDVIDSSSDKTGTMNNSGTVTFIIINTGTLNIRAGNYNGTVSPFQNDGIFNFYNGEVHATNTFTTINNGTMNMNGGNLYSTLNNINMNSTYSYLNVNGGLIDAYNSSIYGNGHITVNDGTLSSGYRTIHIGGSSDITINGGTIFGINQAIDSDRAYINITGGNISNESSDPTISVYQNTVNANNCYIENRGTGNTFKLYDAIANLFGGTYHSVNNSVVRLENSTVNVGNNADAVLMTPTLIGATYAVENTDHSVLNFFDGVLKGRTAAYNSGINQISTGYEIETTSEVIDSLTYEVKKLKETVKFAEYDGVSYNRLNSIIPLLPTDGTPVTIKVIANVGISEAVTIPAGVNLTIELNGLSLNNALAIINNGTLSFIDSSAGKTGIYSSILVYGIENKEGSTLNLTNITFGSGIKGTNSTLNILNVPMWDIDYSGVMNINGGVFANVNLNGTTTISNGTFNQKVNITGNATIENGAFGDIKHNSGIITINNGTYHQVSGNQEMIINGGNYEGMSITGGLTINGGTIHALGGYCLQVGSYSTLWMNDGTIISNNGDAILTSNNANVNINGGTVVSPRYYGIKLGYYSTLNVGKNDGTVSTNNPVILGKTYGVYYVDATFNFYDGIIKGQTNGYNSISNIPSGYEVISGTEVIDGISYVTRYLQEMPDYIKNGENTYNNLATALNEASSGDNLTMINNGKTYYGVVIPAGKTINIDMMGYNLELNGVLDNNGTLNISNTSESESTISSPTLNVFSTINRNVLNLNHISYTGVYGINTTDVSNTTLTNSKMTIKNTAINDVGLLTLNNSNVSSINENAIYNTGNKVLNITGGSVSSPKYTIYNSAANVNLTNTNIIGSIYNYNANTITMNDVLITPVIDGLNNTFYNNEGHIITNNVTVKGDTYYYANYSVFNSDGGTIEGTKLEIDTRTAHALPSSYFLNYSLRTNYVSVTLDNLTIKSEQRFSSFTNNLWQVEGLSGAIIKNLTLVGSSLEYNSKIFGINYYGTGIFTIENINANITSERSDTIGINNASTGSIRIQSGSINMRGAANLFGVMNSGTGSTVIGVQDGLVSTTSPTITAINNGTAVGVKKLTGTIAFYDGIIKSSGQAKPETTSLVEPGYEVTFYRDENNYEYCILEYMTD